MSPPNEVIGIDIVARLDAFRAELAKIPEIGAKDARQLVTALSREIRGAEKASKAAADASKAAARAAREHGAAAGAATTRIQGLTSSLVKAQIGTELLFRGVRLLGRGMREVVDEAVRLDTAAGGDLVATLAEVRAQAHGLFSEAVVPLIPAIQDCAEAFGGLLAGMRESGFLATWAQGLSDVAQGAALATSRLFRLDQVERQRREASLGGQRQIEEQAERIESTKRELAIWETLPAAHPAWERRASEIARITEELEAERRTLRALRGELADLANIGIGEAAPRRGAPAAAAAKPGKAAPSQDRMKGLVDPVGVAAIKEGLEEIGRAYRASAEERLAIQEAVVAQLDSIEQARHDAEMARIDEERQARREAAREWLSVAGASASAITDLVGAVSDASIAATKEETEARLEAQRAAWWAQAIAAIATAAINIPLSISQASTAGYPQAIGYMIAAGVASGAALAGVIAKVAAGPGFHSGGLAPDEQMARVLPGEAVIPRQAVRALGEDRVREVVRGDDAPAPVVVVSRVGHRTTDVSTHESLRRKRGPLHDAIRATQPRAGLHSPWSR